MELNSGEEARSAHRPRQSTSVAMMQSVGAKLLIIALNAATGILSARTLRAAGRGELAAMILWNVLLANAFTFGIPSALTHQLRSHPRRQSELVGAALLLGLLTSALAMMVGFGGMNHWIPQYSAGVIFYSRLFLWNVPVFSWSLIGRAALESDGDFKTSNVSLIVGPLLTLAGLSVLYLSHNLTPVAAAWMYVAMGVPPFGLTLWRVLRAYRPSLQRFRESVRSLMSYGFRSYGIDLCGTMAFYVDQAFVIHLLRPSLMGAYVVALSLSRMLNAFHAAVVMVLFPRITSQPADVILDLTGQAVRITTLLAGTSGLFIVLLGPWLLGFLYGSEYQSATGICRILVIEVVLSGVVQVLSQAFMAMARPGVIAALQVIGLLLTIPFMLVLVPRFGVEGAAGALLISTTVRLIAVMICFRRLLNVQCPRILAGTSDIFKFVAALRLAVRPPSTSVAESAYR